MKALSVHVCIFIDLMLFHTHIESVCPKDKFLFTIVCSCFLRFQSRTSEAAKLEAEVTKAQETIKAADVLISQLDREHRRWNTQVCLGEEPQTQETWV